MKNHNGADYMRPASSMFKLNWDCNLENMAYEHASKCSLQHSDAASRPGIGENIFMTVDRYMNHTRIAELALKIWWDVPTKKGVVNEQYTEELSKIEIYASWSQASDLQLGRRPPELAATRACAQKTDSLYAATKVAANLEC
ncbi:hypothetical protein ANCCAN_01596 [Ancylostoma caninum]|uniref:SCP domain-containing protein n=1 Tax=Ancylostoma caninum TaxID=29170 RepID=A0A368H6F1_ANCCA|nr:hypothetical protein ANCCAN_01596 [Ancylostoma caninum]